MCFLATFQNVQKRTLISIAHVKDSLSTFFKPRNGMNRKLLWMLVFMFILQVTPLFAEVTIAYLYTFFRYDWQVDQYSNYQSITSLARVVSMTVFVPIIKATNANEIYIVLGTNLTFIARCFIKGIALDGWIYYLGKSCITYFLCKLVSNIRYFQEHLLMCLEGMVTRVSEL